MWDEGLKYSGRGYPYEPSTAQEIFLEAANTNYISKSSTNSLEMNRRQDDEFFIQQTSSVSSLTTIVPVRRSAVLKKGGSEQMHVAFDDGLDDSIIVCRDI